MKVIRGPENMWKYREASISIDNMSEELNVKKQVTSYSCLTFLCPTRANDFYSWNLRVHYVYSEQNQRRKHINGCFWSRVAAPFHRLCKVQTSCSVCIQLSQIYLETALCGIALSNKQLAFVISVESPKLSGIANAFVFFAAHRSAMNRSLIDVGAYWEWHWHDV